MIKKLNEKKKEGKKKILVSYKVNVNYSPIMTEE